MLTQDEAQAVVADLLQKYVNDGKPRNADDIASLAVMLSGVKGAEQTLIALSVVTDHIKKNPNLARIHYVCGDQESQRPH